MAHVRALASWSKHRCASLAGSQVGLCRTRGFFLVSIPILAGSGTAHLERDGFVSEAEAFGELYTKRKRHTLLFQNYETYTQLFQAKGRLIPSHECVFL